MATDMAPQSSPRSRPAPPRQLWQVPAFLLGAAAVAAAVFGRHFWQGDDLANAQHYLTQARAALDQQPKPDAAAAIQSGERALALLERLATSDSPLNAQAHFLVGSARLRHADEPGADVPQERQLARRHFEAAERGALPDADKPKLNYRQAKVAAQLGDDPAKVIERLKPAVEAAPDDPVEGFNLLAQTYLRFNPPNEAAALEATQKQLALKDIDPRQATQARARMAELLLKLGKAAEARQLLETIGSDAPQFFSARVLLARSYEETQEWTKAVRNWEQARTDPALKPAEKAALAYRIGRCYQLDGRAREASAAWDEASKLGGEEGRAAGLRLAELRLETNTPAATVDSLAAAFAGTNRPDDWHSALVSLDEARQVLERVFHHYRTLGEFDAAQQVAILYARVAVPGNDDALAGLAADARAQALLEQAKTMPSDKAANAQELVRGHYQLAAQAYEKAAGRIPPGPQQSNWLLNSADRFAKAGQGDQAAAVLARVTQLEGAAADEHLAAAWYALGEMQQKKPDPAAARAAFQHCLRPGSAFLNKARLQLALLDFAENKFDEVEQALVENQKALRGAPQPDVALLEQTEFALADCAYQRESRKNEDEPRDYTTAEQRFLAVLQQFPDSQAVPRTRFYLGKYYWYVATQKSKSLTNPDVGVEERKHLKRLMDEALKKALEQFEKVQETLQVRLQTAPLPPEEASRLRLAEFSSAECCFFLGRYDETLKRYNTLAERYHQQVEELAALSQIWQCHNAQNQPEQSKAVLRRMRSALDQMSDTAFNGTTPYHQRTFWVNWLNEASKPASGAAGQ